MDRTEAADALDAMQASRVKLAAAAECPPERHAAFAAMYGILTASQALPTGWVLGVEAVIVLSVIAVVAWDRRRTGMFINGYRRGRTRKVTMAMLAVFLPLYTLGAFLKHFRGVDWAPVACGIVVTIAAYSLSRLWQRVFTAEMRAQP